MKSKFVGPSITVVIAAFNEEKRLSSCLESLNNQAYSKDKFQVIVVDNNSTDKTAQIAREFGAKIIPEKKQGYVYALKRGMDEAKGEIIAVTDSDTQVAGDWLLTIEKAFASPDVVGVTGLISVNEKSKIKSRLMELGYEISMRGSALIGKAFLSGFNFAVRKNAYLKAGGLDTLFEMSPDVDLGIRLAKFGKVKVNNDLLVCTSIRRWENGFIPTLWDYLQGYIYAAWLRKPPPVKQTVIR